jgi:hypothetical protein
MDAKRLEELAEKCEAALKSPEYWLDNFLQAEDIADLARCAAAWAKVERTSNPMMELAARREVVFPSWWPMYG